MFLECEIARLKLENIT